MNDLLKGIIVGCAVTILSTVFVESVKQNISENQERKRIAVILLDEINSNKIQLQALESNLDNSFKKMKESGYLGTIDMVTDMHWQERAFNTVYNRLGVFDYLTFTRINRYYFGMENLKFTLNMEVNKKNDQAITERIDQIRALIRSTRLFGEEIDAVLSPIALK